MAWIVALAVVVVIGVLVARSRRTRVAITPSQPIPTMYSTMTTKDEKKRAALDAASSILR